MKTPILILALALLVGCFNVDDLKCGPGGACPTGKQCVSELCVVVLPIGGADGDMAGQPAQPDLTGVACSLLPQAGCKSGEKCSAISPSDVTCEPDGPVARGALCHYQAGGDDCRAGNACAGAGGGLNLCRAFCVADADCGAKSYCEVPLGNPVRMCTQACNPLLGSGCPAGMACYVYGNEHTDCRLAGARKEGQICSRPEECEPGLSCYGPAGATRCRITCRPGVQGDCPSAEQCFAVVGDNGAVWPTYGDCQ